MKFLRFRNIQVHFTKTSLSHPLILAVLLFFSPIVEAKVLFEGAYHLNTQSKKVGVIFQKYEFNKNTQQFVSRYFIQANSVPFQSSESLVAISDKNLNPIKYTYTFKDRFKKKKIVAIFKKQKLSATITTTTLKKSKTSEKEKTQTKKIIKKVPKGIFLSTFLNYMILNNGLGINKKMTYKAISEEDFSIYEGFAHVKSKFKYKNDLAYKVSNTFNSFPFTTYINGNGDVLYSHSPLQKISTELMSPTEIAGKKWPHIF